MWGSFQSKRWSGCGTYLSGLSEAQTESIRPTSRVPCTAKETGNRNCSHLKLQALFLVNKIGPENILMNSNSLSWNEHMRKAWVSHLYSLTTWEGAQGLQRTGGKSCTFPDSTMKVWNNLCRHISMPVRLTALLDSLSSVLKTITKSLVPQSHPKNISFARGEPKRRATGDQADTHDNHPAPHCLPSVLPAFLCSLIQFMNHSTATCWKNTHKIVKRRWLWTCPRTGCTVTHHSILWVGLFILHFPQLLRRSAVYSAQDIKPTAGNQNRRKVRIGVAKLGLQYQRTWKAASRNTASFTVSYRLCRTTSLGLIIPYPDVFLPSYLPMKILCVFSNPLTAAPTKSSFLLAIQGTAIQAGSSLARSTWQQNERSVRPL